MSVIRWDNIQLPTSRATATGYNDARTSISGGFDKLAAVLRDREAANQGVVDRTNEAAAQDYLNLIQGFKTPEELNAARMSGVLDQRLAALAPGQQAKVRGSMDARTTSLYQQGNAANAYELSQGGHEAALAHQDAKNAIQPVQDAAALAVAENTRADEALKTSLRDTTEATTRITTQTASQKAEQEAKKVRDAGIVDSLLTPRLAEVNAINDRAMAGLKFIGAEGDFPRDKNGLPDASKMSPDQLASFAELSKSLQLPTSSEQIAAFKADMAEQGVGADAMATALTKAEGLFKTGGSLSVDDQARVAKRGATIAAQRAEDEKSNLFYTPPAELAQAQTAVLEKINTQVLDGPMTVSRLREKVAGWMTEGLEMTRNGKTIKVPVPPKIIDMAFAAGLDKKSWFYNDTDNKMKKLIEDYMTNESNTDQRVRADYLYAEKDKSDLFNYEQKIRREAQTSTPTDFMENFNRRLGKAVVDQNGQPKFQYAPELSSAAPTLRSAPLRRPIK